MKKNFAKATAFLLTAATLATATATATPVVAMASSSVKHYEGFTAWVDNAKGAYLRASTSTSSRKYCKLSDGTAVTVIGTGYKGDGYKWCKVEANGYTGYVTSHLLSTTNPYSNSRSSGGGTTYTVAGTENYLAVRTSPRYDNSNIIARLYNGDSFTVTSSGSNGYAYGHTSNGTYGYVDNEFLRGYNGNSSSYTSSGTTYTVAGTENYLAVRTSPRYDNSNIIARLYNGDSFTVTSSGSNGYAYGHTSNGTYGYVNADYLRNYGGNSYSSSGRTYTVSGTENYLAVRTSPYYDSSNIIGKLYNGDSFTVTGSESNGYVYGHTNSGLSGYVDAEFLR